MDNTRDWLTDHMKDRLQTQGSHVSHRFLSWLSGPMPSPYSTFRLGSFELHESQSMSFINLLIACDRHTLKATSVISWKPSLSSGFLYRDIKPRNAMLGRIMRFSGFIWETYQYTSSTCISITIDACCSIRWDNWKFVEIIGNSLRRGARIQRCSKLVRRRYAHKVLNSPWTTRSELEPSALRPVLPICFAPRNRHLCYLGHEDRQSMCHKASSGPGESRTDGNWPAFV